MAEPWIRLEGLRVVAGDGADARVLVDGAGLALAPGEVLALVGASGSGKTQTVRACLGLVQARPGVVAGALEVHDGARTWRPYQGEPAVRRAAWRALRGRVLGWLPQEARASLDPLRRIGAQVREVLELRRRDGLPLAADRRDAADWLAVAGLPEPGRVAGLYPHELSGGMAQRACLALALARGSRFLLADEPTTGLDPTVQRALLDQLGALRGEGCGLLLVTHDLGVVARLADAILVMDGGAVVERLAGGSLHQATSAPARALVQATLRQGEARP
ncbi:ATP-binding cassette domain-containing protein [Myxococcota bacterium]|nr:ATP-binding cassette domain-containing protein [Myxococcota bacterium]